MPHLLRYYGLFVHPPGLQLDWLHRSCPVGASEGLWATPSRNRCACETSLSIFCRLSSARCLSNSNCLIFSWRFFSAEMMAGNNVNIVRVREKEGNVDQWSYFLHSAQNKGQLRRDDRGGWRLADKRRVLLQAVTF